VQRRVPVLRSPQATVVLVLLCFVPLAVGASKKAPPCKKSLAGCPDLGCAAKGTADALVNQLKRRHPTGTSPATLTLEDFVTLQDQADTLVGQKRPLTALLRKKLTHLSTSGGFVSEGDLVRVMGFLVGTPHANSGESVNCRLPKVVNNDFHITIAEEPNTEEFSGIVVEMIPQARPAAWSLKTLRKIENDETAVLITGQLFYDNKHLVNDDPENPRQSDPKRFSLWEVHPITAFQVCTSGTCDPNKPGDWTPLETFPTK
jgi:hypothetical protein